MNCQILSVLLCLIAVSSAIKYDRQRRAAADEDFGVVRVSTPEAEVEEYPEEGSEGPAPRPGIFGGQSPFFHNIFGNGGSGFGNRRPQFDFSSLLGFMEDQLKKIQNEMKFLLDAEQDPEVVSGLPDDYSNTTSTTKVVNGNEVTVNETIQKIGGNDSNSFFHFKVISIRPVQKPATEEPEATVLTDFPEEFNVEDNEIPNYRRVRRQSQREYEFVPLTEDDESDVNPTYDNRRPSFNPFGQDFNPFSILFGGRPERRRPTVSQRPSVFGFQNPFHNQRPTFHNFPRLPSLFGHDEEQDQDQGTPRPGVFNSFNLGDLFSVMEDQITQLGKEVNVMLNQFGNQGGLLPDNFDNTTSTTKVINGTTVVVNETIHKTAGDFGNSFIHIKIISFGPKQPEVTIEEVTTPDVVVTTPKAGPQETTPESKKKPEAVTQETNEIPSIDEIPEEPENNPLPTDNPADNELTGKFEVRKEPYP